MEEDNFGYSMGIDPPSMMEDDIYDMKPSGRNSDNAIETSIPITKKGTSAEKKKTNSILNKKVTINSNPSVVTVPSITANNKPNNNKEKVNNIEKKRLDDILNKNKFLENDYNENPKNDKKHMLNKIDDFEKKLKTNFEYNYEKQRDSDYEEDLIKEEDLDPTLDKKEIVQRYKIIQQKLKEQNSQLRYLQNELTETKRKNNEVLENMSKDTNMDLKDKKLIELTRKNQDLRLKIEKNKTQIKELEVKLTNLNSNNGNSPLNKQEKLTINNSNLIINEQDDISEIKKKLKQSETKIVETRNKLQKIQEENTKLNIFIRKEIGENIDFEKALKDKTYWKGKAEIIEGLKTKIKILETQISNNSNLVTGNMTNIAGNSDMSMLDDRKTVSSVRNTSVISYNDYKKEKEQMKNEIDKLKEDNAKIITELSRAKSRKEVLEKELKQQKDDLTTKIKILLEKSDNDERLIAALNKELEKRGSRIINPTYLENPTFNLQQENTKLRMELKEKETYINKINANLIEPESQGGNINNNMGKLITKLKELEDENKTLKNQDDGRIYEAISRENAKLRLKIKELEDRLCEN